MDLLINNILNGEAVLFVGAGFSLGATNVVGGEMLTSSQFANKLYKECGYANGDGNLMKSSEIFLDQFGDERLIDTLKNTFHIRFTTAEQDSIMSLDWKRVYTTNYDNVCEQSALKSKGRVIETYDLHDKVEKLSDSKICLHINGFVGNLKNCSSADDVLKLTNTSYYTDIFSNSHWKRFMLDDFASAKSIIFIGYSMYDLDIARIIYNVELLKDKIVFIDSYDLKDYDKKRLERFGRVENIGLTKFVNIINEKASRFVKMTDVKPPLNSFEKFEFKPSSGKPTDDAVVKYLVFGNYQLDYFWNSINNVKKFCILRDESTKIATLIKENRYKNYVLCSDLGNGKSTIVDQIKILLYSSEYEIYSLTKRQIGYEADIDWLVSQKNIIIIIENYEKYLKIINRIQDTRNDSLVLILTCRSISHESAYKYLDKVLGISSYYEADVDHLSPLEVSYFIDIYNEYGMWGRKSNYSSKQKIEFFKKCKNQIQYVLLELFNSPHIKEKYLDDFKSVNDRELLDIFATIFVLQVAGLKVTQDVLNDLIDGYNIKKASFKTNEAVRQFVNFEQDVVFAKSSILSKFILESYFNPDVIRNTLVKIFKKSCFYESGELNDFREIRKQFMRYGAIVNMFPEKGRIKNVIYYYSEIKNIGNTQTNPTFWLQYAICLVASKDYERAEQYFSTAYGYAKQLKGYDDYQIDNYYANYIIKSLLDGYKKEQFFERFEKAYKIISLEIKSMSNKYYPYKVAYHFPEIYIKYKDIMTDIEKKQFLTYCSFILDSIDMQPDKVRLNKYTKDCAINLKHLLANENK